MRKDSSLLLLAPVLQGQNVEKTQLDHFARAGGLPYSLRTGVFVIPLAGIT